MCCNSSWICDKAWGVDEELSEAIVKDWREYYLGENAG